MKTVAKQRVETTLFLKRGNGMGDLTIREDEWSLQITAAGSEKFFIRITTPTNSKCCMVFSDFILNPDDNKRALKALNIMNERLHRPTSGMKLVFQDIYPSYSDGSGRAELVRRHDQIVSVMKEYAAQAGLTVGNSLLEPKADKFETVVLIE